MSCLTIKIGKPLVGNATTIANNIGGCVAIAKNRNPHISALKMSEVNVDVALICRSNNGFYLRVRPSEAMWITVGKGIDYQVISNTDWIII